jgi:hypothetical protein
VSRSEAVRRLGWVAVLFVVLLAALRLGIGARLFSFYGVATATLLALPFATAILSRRLLTLGRPRILLWSLTALVLAASAGQIAFWLLFFNSGHEVLLGIVRSMMREYGLALLPWAAGLVALGFARDLAIVLR